MSPLIARTTAVAVATATMELARRVQQGARGLVHNNIHRLELAIEPLDLLDWIRSQSHATRLYWQDRDAVFESAGLGVTDSIFPVSVQDGSLDLSGPTDAESSKRLQYYGAFRFDASLREDHDTARPCYSCWLVPSIEITRRGDEYLLAINYRDDESSRFETFSTLMNLRPIRPLATNIPRLTERAETVSKSHWCQSVAGGLTRIAQGNLSKFVPARELKLVFDSRIDPFTVVQLMKESAAGSYLFGYQFSDEVAFVGMTPEQLYARSGDAIETESLAGTRARGESESDDKKLEMELLSGEKELREHGTVDDHIVRSLKKLCGSFDADADLSIRKLTRLQHLARKYHGTIRAGISDAEIIGTIHPTPAVCGTPTEVALATLESIEPFDRGWYAGPVGRIGRDEAELAVGIRSAIIQGNQVALYGGAGVVNGSVPEAEWNEIEQKLDSLLHILNAQ